MRKNTFFFILMLMFVVLSLAVTPAFAGYDKGDVMMDQADHHTFSGWNAFNPNINGDHGTSNTWGQRADENPVYRPSSIVIPYANKTYGIWDCPDIYVGEPKDIVGVSIGSMAKLHDQYSHCPTAQPGSNNFYEQEAKLIIQDLFNVVTEGSTVKNPNAKGISQYLDSLFSFSNPDQEANTSNEVVYIDQTLDQDLAHMYGESVVVNGQNVNLGLWQRLHTAVDIVSSKTIANQMGLNSAWIDPRDANARSFDFTMEQYLAEESLPKSSLNPNVTINGLGQGVVISYLGTWFQMGENLKCGSAFGTGTLNCTHNEFGGHGTVTASPYKTNLTQHDP